MCVCVCVGVGGRWMRKVLCVCVGVCGCRWVVDEEGIVCV